MNKMSVPSRIIIAIASLSLMATYFLPVWFIFLIAPQYPEGLTMNIWLNKITGQVDIINGLNHYIGMKHIKADMFPEFGFLVYIVAFFILLGLVVAVTGKRKLLFSYLVLTVFGGVAAMIDFYKWGYDYGHNLDPRAAIQIPGLSYQPPLFGHKTLLNFDAYSYPDSGGWVVIGVGTMFFLVWAYEWYKNRERKVSARHLKTTAPIAALFLVLLSSCSTQPEPFNIGKDACEGCKMAIIDGRFGGEVITEKGRIYKFDDAHCIADFLKSGAIKKKGIAQVVFANYQKENSFLDAKVVHFVVSDQLKSPMNSNAAAFESKTAAEQKAKETGGIVKNWDAFFQSQLRLTSFHPLSAKTVIVGKSRAVTSLHRAIELAGNRDTILLQKGVYKEGNIIIDKPLVLIGEEEPVLDGGNQHEILTISADSVVVKGIHFRNSGYSSTKDHASIGVTNARNVIIENNTITRSYFAIHFANTRESIIRNNTITGTPKTEQTSGNGIHLWKCDNMIVANNEVQGHRDGIYFEFVTNSVIRENNSHNNIRYGLHFMFSNNDAYLKNTFNNNGAGVAVMYSHHVQMQRNSFENNWGPSSYGLLLKEISDASILENRFIQNTVGILMESTNRIDLQLNAFHNNGWSLRIQASCDGNTVHRNNFQGNTFDVATNGTMMLNKFYNNYWDKYEGYDLNRDLVGDVPYHPVSMYSMVIEQNPNSVMLLRSFMVSLLDKAEKAIPSLTPENLVDEHPLMKPLKL